MNPEIIDKVTFYEVEGDFGVDVVLGCDITGAFSEQPGPVPAALRPHCVNVTCTRITKRLGCVCRMSGLEPTRWVGFRTKRKAIEYTLDTFGDGTRTWEKGLRKWLRRLK